MGSRASPSWSLTLTSLTLVLTKAEWHKVVRVLVIVWVLTQIDETALGNGCSVLNPVNHLLQVDLTLELPKKFLYRFITSHRGFFSIILPLGPFLLSLPDLGPGLFWLWFCHGFRKHYPIHFQHL